MSDTAEFHIGTMSTYEPPAIAALEKAIRSTYELMKDAPPGKELVEDLSKALKSLLEQRNDYLRGMIEPSGSEQIADAIAATLMQLQSTEGEPAKKLTDHLNALLWEQLQLCRTARDPVEAAWPALYLKQNPDVLPPNE